MVEPRARGVSGTGRDFFTGIGFLFRGLGMYARSPKIMFLGLIPAVIAGALITGAVVAMIVFSGDLADVITPFDRGWSDGLRETVHVVAMVALIGVTVLLAVFLYAALALLIGEPFYEKISYNVELKQGGPIEETKTSFCGCSDGPSGTVCGCWCSPSAPVWRCSWPGSSRWSVRRRYRRSGCWSGPGSSRWS